MAPSVPATSSTTRFFRPAVTCETWKAPRVPSSQRRRNRGVVVGRHGDRPRGPAARGTAEGLGRADRPPALGVEGGQVGQDRTDLPPDDELGQVHPVGADVGDRA